MESFLQYTHIILQQAHNAFTCNQSIYVFILIKLKNLFVSKVIIHVQYFIIIYY